MTKKTEFIEKLQALIAEGDEVDRCFAIQTIRAVKDDTSTALLIKAMRDDDVDVAVDAITALGELGGDSVTEKLIESLVNDPDGEIKVACVEALAKLADSKAEQELLKLAEKPPEETTYVAGDWDMWWDMQLSSVRGLGRMKSAEAVPVLVRVLEEDDCMDIENEIFNALAEIGGDADDYLLKKLKDGNPRVRRRIVKALGKNTDTSVVKPLARALQDKDADVREATLYALSEREATQYLPAIILTFRDSNAAVRKAAVKVAKSLSLALQETESSDRNLQQKLLPMLHDDDQSVKAVVLDTLAILGWKADDKYKEFLAESLRKASGDNFAALCRFVDSQNISQGVATLLYMFRHKEIGGEEAIHALEAIGRGGQWNSVIETTLGACIFDEKKMVRLAALEALAELDNSFPQGSDFEEGLRAPLDMITETLQGQLKPPMTQKIIPIVPVEEIENKFKKEEQEGTVNEKDVVEQKVEDKKDQDGCTSFVDSALEKIEQSIADGEKPHPMSTLDAIAITHVEDKLEVQAQSENKSAAAVEPEVDKKFEEFMALTEENREISNWLLNKNKVDVSVDIQRLAARMLGKAGSSDAYPMLIDAFDSDDPELKQEAALSLAELSKKGIKPNEILNQSITKGLIDALSAKQRDLRIAAARALGEFGSHAELLALIEMLQDKDTTVRINSLKSLGDIAMRLDLDSLESTKDQEAIGNHKLAELMIEQLNNNKTGVHRAVVDALIPLFGNKLNGSSVSLKKTAIDSLINAGLSGTDGQVKEMSMGLSALDKDLSSIHLLEKLDQVTNSIERRFIVEMLGELYRPV